MITKLELLRIVVITQALLVGLLSLAIAVKYLRSAMHGAGNKVIAIHSFCMGVCTALNSFYIAEDLLERFDAPLSWRSPVALTSFIFGNIGLWFIISHVYVKRVIFENVKHTFAAGAERDREKNREQPKKENE